jgi:hypothetical protein
MEHGSLERRRFPRVAATDVVMAMRPVSLTVQILDLSAEGLLLACPQALSLGAKPRVVATFNGRRLDATLDICHVSSQWDRKFFGYRTGGRFVSLDPTARGVIDALLSERRS